jgi:putative transposase
MTTLEDTTKKKAESSSAEAAAAAELVRLAKEQCLLELSGFRHRERARCHAACTQEMLTGQDGLLRQFTKRSLKPLRTKR